MLAVKEAEREHEKFPMLIGMLRPLSTAVANELLASNGFVIAMVLSDNTPWPVGYINDIRDMQNVISYFSGSEMIDDDNVGAFGFSGSGFSQVLLAMNDPRITALADIESAVYGEGLAEIFLSSDYYKTARLRVPFLHIYGKDLAKSDVKFEEFDKTKYSTVIICCSTSPVYITGMWPQKEEYPRQYSICVEMMSQVFRQVLSCQIFTFFIFLAQC